MDPYEITFIVRPDIDDDATRRAVETVRRRIESAGGEILAAYPWGAGRRRLAYPINDFGDGYYYTIDFNFNPQSVRDFERALQLDGNLLRSLVVTASDLMVKNSQQRVQQQAQQAAQAAAQAQAAAAAPAPVSAGGPAMPGSQPTPSAPTEATAAAQTGSAEESATEHMGEQPAAEQAGEQPAPEGAGELAAQPELPDPEVVLVVDETALATEPEVVLVIDETTLATEPEVVLVIDETTLATDSGLPEEEAPLPPVIVAEPASSDAIATPPDDESVPAEAQPAGSTEGE